MKLIISAFCLCMGLVSVAQVPNAYPINKAQGTATFCPAPQIKALASIPDTLYAKSSGQFTCYNETQHYTWLFDDGQLAEGRNVSHTYAYVGIYAVKLIISNGVASDTLSKNVLVMPAKRQRNYMMPRTSFGINPNPATNGEVMLSFASEAPRTVTIINTVGELIRTEEMNLSSQRLDVSGLPAGIYLLRMEEAGGKTAVSRLIIQ